MENIRTYNLEMAFYACGTAFICRIRDSVSERTYTQICEDLRNMQGVPRDHVLKAQAQIIEMLENLKSKDLIFEMSDFPRNYATLHAILFCQDLPR